MGGTSRPPTVATTRQRRAQQAVPYPAMVFTTLGHRRAVDFLRAAYRRSRKEAVPGGEGGTAAASAGHLAANLSDLHERLRSGRYVAPPVRRSWLEKAEGGQRPMGMSAGEDNMVQRAGAMLRGASDEQALRDFSHGFRAGHSPHQALQELRTHGLARHSGWIVDADGGGCFDNLAHGLLREVMRKRVQDGRLWRLSGKWLHGGVLGGASLTYAERGTPPGVRHLSAAGQSLPARGPG
jgi:RNA-directed DNA polymerase